MTNVHITSEELFLADKTRIYLCIGVIVISVVLLNLSCDRPYYEKIESVWDIQLDAIQVIIVTDYHHQGKIQIKTCNSTVSI